MSDDEITDPDRAAILARRRRFIALAISGLATSGCKHEPQVCLSIAIPEEGEGGPEEDAGEAEAGQAEAGEPPGNDTSGPIVEDPGVPVESDTGAPGDDAGSGDSAGPGEPQPQTNPHPCLRMRPKPTPCLMIMRK